VDGNVVEEFKIGNTTIQICDDYCVKTEEEIERILNRISEDAQRALSINQRS
jgi:hypothetical protein